MVQVTVLNANGESRTLKTSAITDGQPVTGAAVAKALRKTKPATAVGTYKGLGGVTLTVWGWTEGKAGTENKHELPPPHDEGLLFGDAVVVSSAGDFTAESWAEFYEKAFGGFEDISSESGSESEADDYEDEDDDEEDAEDDEKDVESEDAEDDEEDAEDVEDADDDENVDEEDEEEVEDDCCDDAEDGGGGSKRRAPRRRAMAAPEYRRIDMGLRSRVKLPMPLGKRAPRWQTAPELTPEDYDV